MKTAHGLLIIALCIVLLTGCNDAALSPTAISNTMPPTSAPQPIPLPPVTAPPLQLTRIGIVGRDYFHGAAAADQIPLGLERIKADFQIEGQFIPVDDDALLDDAYQQLADSGCQLILLLNVPYSNMDSEIWT